MSPPKFKTRADVKIDRNAAGRRESVRNFIHLQISINLDSWKREVDEATGLAVQPPEPESQIFWWLALAGNLLWAATCLIVPEVVAGAAAAEVLTGEAAERFLTQKGVANMLASDIKSKIRIRAEDANAIRSFVGKTLNFGGAAIGSGALEKIASKEKRAPGADDGKNLVRNIIGKRRATLEDEYKNMRDSWADQLLKIWNQSGDIEPLDLFDLFLWAQMFPRIPYDDERFNELRDNAQEVIESALADYNRQWNKYQRDQMMPQYNQAYALYAMGTLAVQQPFNPKLLFKVD